MGNYIPQNEVGRIIINDMVKKRNAIVPIIGDDTVVYKDREIGVEIPFQAFILQQFQMMYPHISVDDSTIKSIKDRGYYGLSLLSQYYNENGRFLDDFISFVNNNAPNIKLKDEVLDFLVMFNFPIIITTIPFDIIEQQLRGKLEDYKCIWYKLNKENRTLPPRCIYHIFGQAKDGTKWVWDEDLLLTFLLSHNHDVHGAIGLTDYIKENEKKLFVLGCNLPNWLFRFLWQPTQTGRNSNLKTTQGYWINKDKPEDSFDNFLKKKNFSADEQVKVILVAATKLLAEELKREEYERKSMNDNEEYFDVFISYASEDRHIANAIFEALKNMNVKVWFDDRGKGEITPGQKYWEKIEGGIKRSAHYMPIITGKWMQKLTNTSSLKDETYLVRDWLDECKKDGSPSPAKANYSIPIIVKDSMYNGELITECYIEQVAKFGILPKSLFNGIDMISFDEMDYRVFEKIEW